MIIESLGCLRLYGDSRVSRAQPRINAYEISLRHDWLLFVFWGFFASCFEINVFFYFTNLDKLFFVNNKAFPLKVITYLNSLPLLFLET